MAAEVMATKHCRRKTAEVMAVLKDCHQRLLKDSSDQTPPK